jgi:hypothetical protein
LVGGFAYAATSAPGDAGETESGVDDPEDDADPDRTGNSVLCPDTRANPDNDGVDPFGAGPGEDVIVGSCTSAGGSISGGEPQLSVSDRHMK